MSFITVLGISAGAWAAGGLVALQTADGSCADDSGDRYVDCGNGTVTDNQTGLVWLADASCFPVGYEWSDAMDFVAGLSDKPASSAAADQDCGLSDNSSPGEWRLPSAEELEAMVADANTLGCDPPITTDNGAGCYLICLFNPERCSFHGLVRTLYWSSSVVIESDPSDPAAWALDTEILTGKLSKALFRAKLQIWPVRGGQ